MKLSEAIKIGIQLRPESHQERFINVENRGLCSDVWGAAIEAVYPAIAKRNWDPRNIWSFESSMKVLRELQNKYFGEYFKLPARCPARALRYVEQGGRVINSKGEFVPEGKERETVLAGITTECDKVEQLAGLIDHMFYAHNWSREECAQAVEWYEQTRTSAMLTQNFAHHQNDQLRQKHQERMTAQQIAFLRNRRNGRVSVGLH